MSGIDSLPLFLRDAPIPDGYYDSLDPYKVPSLGNVNLRALSQYADKANKAIIELTREEFESFEQSPTSKP